MKDSHVQRFQHFSTRVYEEGLPALYIDSSMHPDMSARNTLKLVNGGSDPLFEGTYRELVEVILLGVGLKKEMDRLAGEITTPAQVAVGNI